MSSPSERADRAEALALSVLAAVQAEPGQWSAYSLACDLGVGRLAIRRAIESLTASGYTLVLRERHGVRSKAGELAEEARRLYEVERLSWPEIDAALRPARPRQRDAAMQAAGVPRPATADAIVQVLIDTPKRVRAIVVAERARASVSAVWVEARRHSLSHRLRHPRHRTP